MFLVKNKIIMCISRYESLLYSVYFYKEEAFYLDDNILSDIIFPGLLHELKLHLSEYGILTSVMTSPSKYVLPSFINPLKLYEQIRSIIGSSLVFIHTWIKENKKYEILDESYDNYYNFFDKVLLYIIVNENNPSVIKLVVSLKDDIKMISSYLGVYNGHFSNNFIKTNTLLQTLLITYLYTKLVQ